jgi:threonine aldolase
MKLIDLRSDTTTRPTKEMLDAMYKAEVGEDNYGEDPTANRLQELAAEMMGKEAAIFLPTGTMCNQIAILTHSQRGDEMVCDSEAHTFIWERGGPAVISSVLVRSVPSNKGVLEPERVSSVMRSKDSQPRTSLLWIENTHCWHGGTVTPLKRMNELCKLAHDNGARVHVDGARIFSAALALGVKASDLVAQTDSVMFCLSKSLCCPAGSMLTGSKAFIEEAKYYRKFLGGQMRQVGYLAAAGIVALETMVNRLQEDHENAKILATGLKNINGIEVDVERVQTNMVLFDIATLGIGANQFLSQLKEEGVLAVAYTDSIIRMVPTIHTTEIEIKEALTAVKKVVDSLARSPKQPASQEGAKSSYRY